MRRASERPVPRWAQHSACGGSIARARRAATREASGSVSKMHIYLPMVLLFPRAGLESARVNAPSRSVGQQSACMRGAPRVASQCCLPPACAATISHRFNEIQKELSQLSTKFSNNVLDATKAFKKVIKDKAEVDGLPASALGLGAQLAKAEGFEDATPEEGPWVFSLDFPSFFPGVFGGDSATLPRPFFPVAAWSDVQPLVLS